MKTADYWDLFYETGRVDDYLQYACTSEESQLEKSGQEEIDNARERNGYGAFSITH